MGGDVFDMGTRASDDLVFELRHTDSSPTLLALVRPVAEQLADVLPYVTDREWAAITRAIVESALIGVRVGSAEIVGALDARGVHVALDARALTFPLDLPELDS